AHRALREAHAAAAREAVTAVCRVRRPSYDGSAGQRLEAAPVHVLLVVPQHVPSGEPPPPDDSLRVGCPPFDAKRVPGARLNGQSAAARDEAESPVLLRLLPARERDEPSIGRPDDVVTEHVPVACTSTAPRDEPDPSAS